MPLREEDGPDSLASRANGPASTNFSFMSGSKAAFESARTEQIYLRAEEEHWLIHEEDLVVQAYVLGKGGFGEVRLGVLHSCTDVAVKLMKGTSRRNAWVAFNEMRMLRRIRHPNIVLFHGVYLCAVQGGESQLAIVLELVDGPNLAVFVRTRRKNGDFKTECGQVGPDSLAHQTFVQCHEEKLALDTCRGMVHLHGQHPPMLHRDLKPENILVDTSIWPPKAKVTDFGLGTLVETNAINSVVGTTRYMAPEVSARQPYDTAADVFSFGCIGVFMVTARHTAPSEALATCRNAADSCPRAIENLRAVAESCLHHTPAQRKSFKQLAATLAAKAARPAEAHKSPARSAHLLNTSQHEFPMWVMPIAAFMELTEWQSFYGAKAAGLLKSVDERAVHYVSHEWLSSSHPDPDGIHFRALQQYFTSVMYLHNIAEVFSHEDWETFATGCVKNTQVAARIATSQITSSSSHTARISNSGTFEETVKRVYRQDVADGSIWIDWLCIPQFNCDRDIDEASTLDDQESAIQCVPKYISQSTYFYICTPAAKHESGRMCNLQSWQRRGWCRFEETCNFMSPEQHMTPVVLTQAPTVKLREFFDFFIFCANRREGSIFNGNFACCDCKHAIKRDRGRITQIRCDKTSLATVVARQYDAKVLALQRRGISFLFRIFKCMEAAILAGSDLDRQAVVCSPVEQISEFLQRFELSDDPFKPDDSGGPAIEWAAFAGHVPMVRKLLDHKCPADVVDNGGLTPLLGAVLCNDATRMTEMLLSAGCLRDEAINASTKGMGISPLDRAAKGNNTDIVLLLLEARACVNSRRKDGCTPLLSAALACHSDVDVCRLLLEHRADINAVSNFGEGVLHMAAQSLACFDRLICEDAVALLLTARADPRLPDFSGQTPIDIAEREGNSEFRLALLKAGSVSQESAPRHQSSTRNWVLKCIKCSRKIP